MELAGPPVDAEAPSSSRQLVTRDQEVRGSYSLPREGHPNPQPHPGPERSPQGLATSWLPSPQKTAAHSVETPEFQSDSTTIASFVICGVSQSKIIIWKIGK